MFKTLVNKGKVSFFDFNVMSTKRITTFKKWKVQLWYKLDVLNIYRCFLSFQWKIVGNLTGLTYNLLKLLLNLQLHKKIGISWKANKENLYLCLKKSFKLYVFKIVRNRGKPHTHINHKKVCNLEMFGKIAANCSTKRRNPEIWMHTGKPLLNITKKFGKQSNKNGKRFVAKLRTVPKPDNFIWKPDRTVGNYWKFRQ